MSDGYFSLGIVDSPITSATTNTLLQDVDPALSAMLDFYKSVIETHIGPRFEAEMERLGLTFVPVADTASFDPLPTFQEAQWKFPLLALYRKSEKYDEFTFSRHQIRTGLDFLWILPPLSPSQCERLLPFRTHVARTIVDRSMMGADSGYLSGARVFANAGVTSVSALTGGYGNIPSLDSDLFFPTVQLSLEIVETKEFNTHNGGSVPLTGVSTQLDEGTLAAVILTDNSELDDE